MAHNQNNTGTGENIMGFLPERRLLLMMSIPMMISMFVQAFYNVVDSVFVAQLSEGALTAISLSFPLQNLMIAVNVGTNIGVNAYLSRSLGARDFPSVNRTAGNSLFLAALNSVFFILLGVFFVPRYFASMSASPAVSAMGSEYLRICLCAAPFSMGHLAFERLLQSTGHTRLTMISQTVGALLNIVLDPIMIFGLFGFPRLEVVGAALATIIGQFAGLLLAMIFHFRVNTEIRFRMRDILPSAPIIKEIYRVGLPSVLMLGLGSLTNHFMNAIMLTFSETATAVYGAFFRLQSFAFLPIFGLRNGMMPIVAYNYGAERPQRIRNTVRLASIYATVLMAVAFLLFQLLPGQMLALFNASEQMLLLGRPALRLISTSFLLAGFNVVVSAVYQALGNGMYSLLNAFVRQIIVLLPAAWLLAQWQRLELVWLAFPLAEIACLLLSLVLLRRIWRERVVPMEAIRALSGDEHEHNSALLP